MGLQAFVKLLGAELLRKNVSRWHLSRTATSVAFVFVLQDGAAYINAAGRRLDAGLAELVGRYPNLSRGQLAGSLHHRALKELEQAGLIRRYGRGEPAQWMVNRDEAETWLRERHHQGRKE